MSDAFINYFTGGTLLLIATCLVLLRILGGRAVQDAGILLCSGSIQEVHGDGSVTVQYTANGKSYTVRWGEGLDLPALYGKTPPAGLKVTVTVQKGIPDQPLSVKLLTAAGRGGSGDFVSGSPKIPSHRLILLAVGLYLAGIYMILRGTGLFPFLS